MRGFRSDARSELVSIETAEETENGYGHESQAWSEQFQEYASVRFGAGDERRAAAQEGGIQAATFGFDYSVRMATLGLKARLGYHGGKWDITSVVVEPRNSGVVVTAVRAV